MTTHTDFHTVAARDLIVGDTLLQGGVVTRLTSSWGVVAVWLDGNAAAKADHVFNHGDPVKVTTAADLPTPAEAGWVDGGHVGRCWLSALGFE